MGDLFNLREVRRYPLGFKVSPQQHMLSWLEGQQFKVKMTGTELKGSKRGIHINFQVIRSTSFYIN